VLHVRFHINPPEKIKIEYPPSDTVAARTLGYGVNIPGGTTAESCTAACQAAGGFANAGLENGHECCEYTRRTEFTSAAE